MSSRDNPIDLTSDLSSVKGLRRSKAPSTKGKERKQKKGAREVEDDDEATRQEVDDYRPTLTEDERKRLRRAKNQQVNAYTNKIDVTVEIGQQEFKMNGTEFKQLHKAATKAYIGKWLAALDVYSTPQLALQRVQAAARMAEWKLQHTEPEQDLYTTPGKICSTTNYVFQNKQVGALFQTVVDGFWGMTKVLKKDAAFKQRWAGKPFYTTMQQAAVDTMFETSSTRGQVRVADPRESLAIESSTGTGKTRMMCMAAAYWLSINPAHRAIFVATLSTNENVRREMELIWTCYLCGKAPARQGAELDVSKIKTQVKKALEDRVRFTTGQFTEEDLWTDECDEESMVIVDEVQRYRPGSNPKKKKVMTALLEQCTKKLKRAPVLFVSGTFVYNTFKDLESVIQLLPGADNSPVKDPISYYWMAYSCPNLPMPKKLVVNVRIEIRPLDAFVVSLLDSSKQAFYTKKRQATVLKDVGNEEDKITDEQFRMRLKSNFKLAFALYMILACPKDKFLVFAPYIDFGVKAFNQMIAHVNEKLRSIRKAEKRQLKKAQEAAKAAAKKQGKEFKELKQSKLSLDKYKPITARMLTGKTTPPKQQEALDAYNSGEIRVLALSPALAVGVDLPETDKVINMDLGWTFASFTQSENRGRRLGSTREFLPVYRVMLSSSVVLTGDDITERIRNRKWNAAKPKLAAAVLASYPWLPDNYPPAGAPIGNVPATAAQAAASAKAKQITLSNVPPAEYRGQQPRFSLSDSEASKLLTEMQALLAKLPTE